MAEPTGAFKDAEVLGDEAPGAGIAPVTEGAALLAVTRAEIDSSIATAKAYPRSEKRAAAKILAAATLSEDAATQCVYSVPRGGKTIHGPSIRMAEVIATAWGNIAVGTRTVAVDIENGRVTVEAIAHDLEANVRMRAEVTERLKPKHGQTRADEDTVQTTILAAQAKARRNAIIQVVPGMYVVPAVRAALSVLRKESEPLAERQGKAVKYLADAGIPVDRVLARFEIDDVKKLDSDMLVAIKTSIEAIRHGEVTPEDAFPPAAGTSAPSAGAAKATEKIKASTKAATAQPAQPAQPGPVSGSTKAATPAAPAAAPSPAVEVPSDDVGM